MGAVHPGDFFHGDDIGNIIQTLAAVFFGDEHPEQAEVGHFLHEIEGEFLFFVQLLGDRLYLLLGEIANGIPEYLLLLGEIVVKHACPFFIRS